MKKSQGKLKLLGCIFVTFVISAGLFVSLSSKRSHNSHVHAEDSIQWTLDTTTGYHSYVNENENIDWQARPVNVFYLERTSTLRVNCDIYDMTSSADGVLLEDTNVSFDFGIGANSYDIVSGDAGPVYRFRNLTCTECGATMQTFDMPINQVGIVVSDYDEASWVYSSNINFHQKNVSSQQFSYTAVPVDLKYDETNQYLKVTCNVSIYDLQNNTEIIYTYQEPSPVFWYEAATCDPLYDGQQQMTGYACTGRCVDDQRLEEFDVGSSVSRSLVDLSDEFPSGSGQQEKQGFYCENNQLVYYFDSETLADLQIVQIIYHREGQRNELILYIDLFYESGDLASHQTLQIDNPEFAADVIPGMISLEGTITGYCGQLSGSSDASFRVSTTPFSYIKDGWSYNDYEEKIIYINPDNIEWAYRIDVADVYTDCLVLSYNYEAYSEPIIVDKYGDGYNEATGKYTGQAYIYSEDSQILVTIDLNEISVEEHNEPYHQSQTDYEPGWNYDSNERTLVYYDETNLETYFADSLSISYFVFYTSDVADEQYVQIVYTTPAGSQLPEISLTYASYRENNNDYTVIGIYLESPDNIVYLTISSDNWNTREITKYNYEVIFDGNGSTSGTMEPDTFTSKDYSLDYELPVCDFEKEGCTFAGWALSESGMIKFQPGQTRNITNGTTTFYAIWTENLTITFEANGGTGYMEPIVVASGTRREVPSCDFEYEGYSFVHWAVNSPSSSMTVNPGDPVTVTQNYVLYAIWESEGPVQHEGMWYDESQNRLRFYNTDLGGEQEVKLQVTVFDYGPNKDLTRAELSADIYYEDSIWETRSYEMRTFTLGEDARGNYIIGEIYLDDGEGQHSVKLYADTFYNNVLTPGLNYIEPYKQIFYVNPQYDSSVVQFEKVEINEITRKATLAGYAVDATGGTDLLNITLTLTNASVNVDEMYGDGQILTGYWEEQNRTIELYVFDVIYNSLEEEPITEETIEEINNGMDKVDLSDDQKQQINDKIDENADRIGESTGVKISQALDGTTDLMSDNPEFAEKQKEVIVVVVETAIDVETNKGSDIGQGREVDTVLPDDAGLNVEQEIREFYERQMQELLGGKETPTRSPSRALTNSYKIDVDISGIEDDKVISHLDNEIASYGKMMNFIDSSVSHMSEAALRIKKCSGEALKVSVKNYVTVVKVSSFREFDKKAADAEFLDNVYRAIMLHMQEQVINTLESQHKDSGNSEKEAVYQEELAAVKDYDTFEIMVTEVLRQKYVALTGDETYTQDNLDEFFNEIYWPIFKAWALDEEIPKELKDKGVNITLEQLTTTTIEQSSSRARSFTVHSDLQNNEIIFLAAFGGGVVLFISLAAIIPTIINKKRARGLVK